MAQNVTDWVWKHSRAVNGSLIVLLAIAHEANRDGEAEMSAAELAAKCRLGERTVQSAVKELSAAGELHATRGGGRGRRTRYRVPAVNPADPAGFEPVNPAGSAPFEPVNPADPAGFTETPQDLRGLSLAVNPADPAGFNGDNGRSEDASQLNPAGSAGLGISDMFIVTTGSKEVQVKEVPAIVSRDDVERLCARLADRVEANGSRRPAVGKKWRDAARLMIDRDGRTEQQVAAAIDWCQDHEFWRANILSMPKLREKYDQLRLQATRANGNGSTTNARVRAGLDLAEKYALQERQLSS